MSNKGQTITDRLNAAKYTLAGQALARCICKATTEEPMRPKKKHLDYLAACTNESNVSMMQIANMLIERTNHSNWVVVYKALITVHHLMSSGSERFTQYLASSNYSFQLSGFVDRNATKGYTMSAFIRRYSDYINQKALSYRTLAVDLCRSQRDGTNLLRNMPIERLLESLPITQKQLDTLLDFGATASELSNSIITASFTLLFHDAIRLFASYNDGIINLFEKYFDLNKKMCRDAFDAYKKFLSCTDRVAEFLKVAEAINLNRGDLPDFKRAPGSLLDALEQHLISLESNKKRDRVVIDTKLATFPSFSAANTSLDYCPTPVADMACELDASLTFAETSDENQPEQKIDEAVKIDDIFSSKLSPTSMPEPYNNNTVTEFPNLFESHLVKKQTATSSSSLLPRDPVDSKIITRENLFELNPPGYSGGAMLTPEPTISARLDPSIDPVTQQQLIQIKREQTAAGRQKINSPNIISETGTNGLMKSSAATIKAKRTESIFEDLEKTMRQSILKTGKT